MTMVQLAGSGSLIPPMPGITVVPSLATTLSLLGANASDRLSQIGRVVFPERTGSKSLTKVHFLFGAVVKTNGSTLRVSLQDVDLTAGPPMRPDGTVDQSVTIANADSGFASNQWYTATLGSARTVNYGDLLAVVFDWASAVSGDSVVITGYSLSSGSSNAGAVGNQYGAVQFTASTWSAISMVTNIILEFSDGSFGTLDGSLIASAIGTTAFNNTSNPDEHCLEFQFPFDCEVDGMYALVAANADFEMILYSGTTALATVTVDANTAQSTAARWTRVAFPKQTLLKNTTYRVAVRPTTASNVTIYHRDVSNASHKGVEHLGTTASLNSRTDAGAWGTPTATRRPLMGVRICAVNADLGITKSHAYCG